MFVVVLGLISLYLQLGIFLTTPSLTKEHVVAITKLKLEATGVVKMHVHVSVHMSVYSS